MKEITIKPLAQIGDFVKFQTKTMQRTQITTIEAYYLDHEGLYYHTVQGDCIKDENILAVSNPNTWTTVREAK